MSVTPVAAPRTTDETPQVWFQATRFDAAMARLGHHTERTRAQAAGVSRMTLHRWRREGFAQTPATAHKVAAVTGLTVDQLFVRTSRASAEPAA